MHYPIFSILDRMVNIAKYTLVYPQLHFILALYTEPNGAWFLHLLNNSAGKILDDSHSSHKQTHTQTDSNKLYPSSPQ